MTVLLDTNLLLRLVQPTDPAHAVASAAVVALRTTGEPLYTVPQNLFEFWVVATRPVANNGLGLSTVECAAEITHIKSSFPVLLDTPALLAEWEALVAAHDCKGKLAHDARLVAAMRTHGLTRLLTFNGADFARYPGLTVLDPASIVAPPP
jgi:predicted nucleic acid-binding protein